MTTRYVETQCGPVAPPPSRYRRRQAIAVTTERRFPRRAQQRGRLSLSFGMVVRARDILEGDPALDFLAGENSVIFPVHEDTDIARRSIGRHG